MAHGDRRRHSRGAQDLFPFYWEVPKQGFRWVTEPPDEDGIASRSLVLASSTTAGTASEKRYNPLLKRRTLFATFAETPPTEDRILAFANEYGLLGSSCIALQPESIMLEGDPASPIPGLRDNLVFDSVGVGESFESWTSEITAMRRALELWTAARDSKLAALRRMLAPDNIKEAEKEFQTRVNTPVGLFPWPDVSLSLSIAPYSKADNRCSLMAWLELQETISCRLSKHVVCRIVYSADDRRPRLRFIPKTLLGALWLQFARAVDGGKEDRTCAYCSDWIEPMEQGRVTRRYCSDACRRKAFDARKRKGGVVRAKGVAGKEVAKSGVTGEEERRKKGHGGVTRRGVARKRRV